MPTIEIRVDVTGVPHSFIIINNGAGFEQGYGFAPATANDPAGPGHVYPDTDHPYDFSSGPINITNEQYNAIAAKINADIANPPYYNAPGSILFPGTVQQCAQWVTDLAQQSNVSLPFTMHRGGWNPYGQAVWIGVDNAINAIGQSIANLFNAAQAIPTLYDPLTLDLNGNGLETVPLKTPPLLFDLNADGIKTSTGWIAPSDGLLVMDRNGNGMIDSGAELFGDATPLYDSAGQLIGKAADGFAALAQEDTNHDGVVNNLDANFANLKVWQDLNQDGISQPNELTSLDQQGIASFNVARTLNKQTLASGNQLADLGTYTKTDGSTGATGAPQGMADINLAADTFHRTFTDTIPTTAQTDALPDMQGSGLVRDLRQAASLQTAAGQALAAKLSQFAQATTRAEQMALIDDLLTAWGNTSGFGDMRTRSQEHGYTLTIAGHITPLNEKHLAVLEQFNGRSFYKMPWEGATMAQSALQGLRVGWNGNPKNIAVGWSWMLQEPLLEQAYTALKDSVYQALLPQTRLKPYLDAIGLTLDSSGSFTLDFSAVQTLFADATAANPAKALGDLLIGGAGNDDVSGDGTYITDSLNWAVTETHGNDRLRQRAHAEIINSEAANEEITHTWRIAA